MTRVTTRVLDVATTVPTTPLDPRTVVDGAPAAGSRALAAVSGVEVGVWEMTPGTATEPVSMLRVTPTLAAWLAIPPPSNATAAPLISN